MATAPFTPELPIEAMLARFGRAKVESFIEIAIALLDLADGDCDLEDDNEDACLAGEDTGTSRSDHDDGAPGDPDDAKEDHRAGRMNAAGTTFV